MPMNTLLEGRDTFILLHTISKTSYLELYGHQIIPLRSCMKLPVCKYIDLSNMSFNYAERQTPCSLYSTVLCTTNQPDSNDWGVLCPFSGQNQLSEKQAILKNRERNINYQPKSFHQKYPFKKIYLLGRLGGSVG